MIAYDHSRVLLSAIDGMLPADIFTPSCCIDSKDSLCNSIFLPQERNHTALLKYIPTQASQTYFHASGACKERIALEKRQFSLKRLRQAFRLDDDLWWEMQISFISFNNNKLFLWLDVRWFFYNASLWHFVWRHGLSLECNLYLQTRTLSALEDKYTVQCTL